MSLTRDWTKLEEKLKKELVRYRISDYGELVSIADTKESYSFGIIDLLRLSEKL